MERVMEPLVLRTFEEPIVGSTGMSYVAKICGRVRSDGRWEAWVEFVPEGGTPILRSRRETSQPNLRNLEGWVERLSRVYLQGSLDRTLHAQFPPLRGPLESPESPHFAGPAGEPEAVPAPDDAAINPFLEYSKGMDLLIRKLDELSMAELRDLTRAYGLDQREGGVVELEGLERADLIALIVRGVHDRVRS
jgi:hypothetical protein